MEEENLLDNLREILKEKFKKPINEISLKEFDDLVLSINMNNEYNYFVKKQVIENIEKVCDFIAKEEILINPFKSEIKSGLINLLEISNNFPYIQHQNFSIKKKETINDIILKNSSEDKKLFPYDKYYDLMILLENNGFNSINLKNTQFDIDLSISKEEIKNLIKNFRIIANSIILNNEIKELEYYNDFNR